MIDSQTAGRLVIKYTWFRIPLIIQYDIKDMVKKKKTKKNAGWNDDFSSKITDDDF